MELAHRLQALSTQDGVRFRAMFDVQVHACDKIQIPDTLQPKIDRWFGKPADHQQVLHTRNLHTGETSTFNELRAGKPRPTGHPPVAIGAPTAAPPPCDFCAPMELTSAASWGRVSSEHFVSAANASHNMPHHGLLLRREHDTLDLLPSPGTHFRAPGSLPGNLPRGWPDGKPS